MAKIMKFFMKNLVDVGYVYWGSGFIYILCVMNYQGYFEIQNFFYKFIIIIIQ